MLIPGDSIGRNYFLMRTIKIMLFGKHSCRTPLSYEPYQGLAKRKIEFEQDPANADILLTGFSKDFHDQYSNLKEILEANKSLRLLIISEEPLWDTIYASEYQASIVNNLTYLTRDEEIPVHYYAHHNSKLFDYETIPYFLTTDLRYSLRYLLFINSWLRSSAGERMNRYKENRKQFTMIAEKRTEPWFEYSNPNLRLAGLSLIRSQIGLGMASDSDVYGKGFDAYAIARQQLPDWHLDKISRTYCRYHVMSAIENTLHSNYVTEKIFDAFACSAMPLYCANADHSVYSMLGLTSLINIYGLSTTEACDAIRSFNWSSDAIEAYEADALNIFNRFSDLGSIRNDMISRCNEIIRICETLLDSENKIVHV
jgi:hypothetical protein